MKKVILEDGEAIFKEVDPLFPDKLAQCGSCGKVVEKKTMRFITKLGKALCEGCRKEVCRQCNGGV